MSINKLCDSSVGACLDLSKHWIKHWTSLVEKRGAVATHTSHNCISTVLSSKRGQTGDGAVNVLAAGSEEKPPTNVNCPRKSPDQRCVHVCLYTCVCHRTRRWCWCNASFSPPPFTHPAPTPGTTTKREDVLWHARTTRCCVQQKANEQEERMCRCAGQAYPLSLTKNQLIHAASNTKTGTWPILQPQNMQRVRDHNCNGSRVSQHVSD